jgi:hypothetical protein
VRRPVYALAAALGSLRVWLRAVIVVAFIVPLGALGLLIGIGELLAPCTSAKAPPSLPLTIGRSDSSGPPFCRFGALATVGNGDNHAPGRRRKEDEKRT